MVTAKFAKERLYEYRMVPYLDIWEVARLYHVSPSHYEAANKVNSSQSNDSSYTCYFIFNSCVNKTVEGLVSITTSI